MAKIIRFVSDCEKEMYLSGARLMNPCKHTDCKSTSIGFCFAEVTPKRNADKWIKKLYFVTAHDWCIEFDTADFKIPLNESTAVYADDNDFNKHMQVREWCTMQYALDTHPYRRIGKCPTLQRLTVGAKIVWKD